MNKWGLFQGWNTGSIFENQTLNPFILVDQRRKITWSYRVDKNI